MTPDQFTAHQIDWLYRAEADRIAVWEDADSVRSPGWFRAQCMLGDSCEWETSGAENTVKDSVREHVGTHPLGRLLSLVSDAVRNRGDALASLPDRLGEIWARSDDYPARKGLTMTDRVDAPGDDAGITPGQGAAAFRQGMTALGRLMTEQAQSFARASRPLGARLRGETEPGGADEQARRLDG